MRTQGSKNEAPKPTEGTEKTAIFWEKNKTIVFPFPFVVFSASFFDPVSPDNPAAPELTVNAPVIHKKQ